MISQLALHYVEDLTETFRKVYRVAQTRRTVDPSRLNTPSSPLPLKVLQVSERRTAWLVDDYFKTGARVYAWMGSDVIKYHRTVEDLFSSLQEVGFSVESLRESKPVRERSMDVEEYRRRLRIPLFIFFAARKA